MWGKHNSSMYSGSMVGAGAIKFAVLGYVIANMRPDRRMTWAEERWVEAKGCRMVVELNPKLLAAVLGESEEAVNGAVEFLCAADPNSRSKEEEGRRLVRLGQFEYWVVNGMKYRKKRDEWDRREQTRKAVAKLRARRRGVPLSGEVAGVKAFGDGDENGFERLAEGDLAKYEDRAAILKAEKLRLAGALVRDEATGRMMLPPAALKRLGDINLELAVLGR